MKIITVREMEPDQIYLTAQSAKKFKVTLLSREEGKPIMLKAFYPLLGWKVVMVPDTYKVSELSAEDQLIEQNPVIRNTPNTIPGKVSGLPWRASWAKWLKEVGQDVKTGKAAVIEKMIAEFPHRELAIRSKPSEYRFRYNSGQLPGGRTTPKIYWLMEPKEPKKKSSRKRTTDKKQEKLK